ncbi:MAG: hypothetical protein LBK50_00285 [Candidatus Nomurabacteria bacterium]|jgi:type VI protein secretion system component VasK|nr:hypothetical protein [Candidatus Nomurabacteria bacterium]
MERSDDKRRSKGKTIAIVSAIVIAVAALAGVGSYIYSYVAIQNFRRDVSAQIQNLADSNSFDAAAQLQHVPFGVHLNSQYARLSELQADYSEMYDEFVDYYARKDSYEASMSTYNARVKAGESVNNYQHLDEERTKLKDKEAALNEKLEDLKNKMNNL